MLMGAFRDRSAIMLIPNKYTRSSVSVRKTMVGPLRGVRDSPIRKEVAGIMQCHVVEDAILRKSSM